MSKISNQRIRFTVEETITVFQSVVYENPFENTTKWQIIADKLNTNNIKKFTARGIREHVQHHLKTWIKENNANIKK